MKLSTILEVIGTIAKDRRELVIENAFLRYQLSVLKEKQKYKRIPLSFRERSIISMFCTRLSRWKELLYVVQPDTLIRWHRKGFGKFWARKAGTRGRAPIRPHTISLIQKMSRENYLLGAPRIRSELLKLGIRVAESTIDKYRIKHRRPPSQSWKAFLRNHTKDIVSVDFFTVPTLTFKLLHAFVILSHDRRKIIHWGVTSHPTELWTNQQVREAFSFQALPKFILRDNGCNLRKISELGSRVITTRPGCPWQNGYVERIIGSIRRECLDHLIIFNQRHLERVLKSYFKYYNRSRPHLSLDRDSPDTRLVFEKGRVVRFREVGGLHHRYERQAA
jgi:putative transposase